MATKPLTAAKVRAVLRKAGFKESKREFTLSPTTWSRGFRAKHYLSKSDVCVEVVGVADSEQEIALKQYAEALAAAEIETRFAERLLVVVEVSP